MPAIKSSRDVRNGYNEISEFCQETGEPVFITKNGRGDLAVMSIDAFNKLMGRYELYRLLDESEADFASGRTIPFEDSMKSIRQELADGTL